MSWSPRSIQGLPPSRSSLNAGGRAEEYRQAESNTPMCHPLLDVAQIEQTPAAYLEAVGGVFAVFDTQDSGNLSYGVQVGHDRYFVKTAGLPDDPQPYLPHPERVSLLRNAVCVRRCCDHPALPLLYQVIESPDGPLLVYEWVEGELIGVQRASRDDPQSTYQRFRRLPVPEIERALDVIYTVHDELARSGWVAVDFYDGCMIYEFERHELHLMDLDTYRQGPSTNDMGRMFGSSRFMAPEEFEQGAPIDERTNVFTMGRTAALFLSDGTLERPPFRGSDAQYDITRSACSADRRQRFSSTAEFCAAWREARQAS
jgi:serine/threonine-protein kinase